MEAFAGERSGKECLGVAIGFAEIIKGIEKDCEKSLMNRKNQMLFKQQLKENWLSRTKIIPPSFPKIEATETSNYQGVLKPNNAAENHSINQSKPKSEEEKPPAAREGCKTSHDAVRNIASCKRVRSNWKLQFRKDELNILRYKYARNKEEETYEPEVTGKSFKVRRVFKRLDEMKHDLCSNTRGFCEFSDEKMGNSRERLKTAQLSPVHKQRYFA